MWRVWFLMSVMPMMLVNIGPAPVAHASDFVTYEVVSEDIDLLDVEFTDLAGRNLIENVALPWRRDAEVVSVENSSAQAAQVRANWLSAMPNRWVTVRIYRNGKLLCQSTMDVGNATCYGSVPHIA